MGRSAQTFFDVFAAVRMLAERFGSSKSSKAVQASRFRRKSCRNRHAFQLIRVVVAKLGVWTVTAGRT